MNDSNRCLSVIYKIIPQCSFALNYAHSIRLDRCGYFTGFFYFSQASDGLHLSVANHLRISFSLSLSRSFSLLLSIFSFSTCWSHEIVRVVACSSKNIKEDAILSKKNRRQKVMHLCMCAFILTQRV